MTDYRHPAMLSHRAAQNAQEKLAEVITNFAGSMTFVYIHAVIFTVWIVLNAGIYNFDPFPYGLLTLVVSLEAIFLSTFVMIGQNRQGRFAALKAEHDYKAQVLELQNNTKLTLEINDLVKEVHAKTCAPPTPRRRSTKKVAE